MIDSVAEAKEKLKTLVARQVPEGMVMSATLSTSRLDDWRQFAPAFLRSEFARVVKESGASKDEKRSLQADLDCVLDVVKYEVTPRTQGLAVFVDSSSGFSERIELPLRLVNRVVIEPFAHIRPLVHALALLEPFVLARVSRDESRLYLVDEWGIASEDGLSGPWLRSSDRETGEVSIKEYYAAARQDSLVDLHFKEVGASLAKLTEASGARRIILCAQHDIAVAFRRTLPASTATEVVGEIPHDAAASIGQMVISAREAMERARHEETAKLAERIKEGLGPGARGVSGFDDVLTTVSRHQMQTLLVDRNYRPPGRRCSRCGWVGLTHIEPCPVCGGSTAALSDAAGEVVRLTIAQGGRVEVGEDIPVLDELGGMAGLLRYA